MSQRAFYRYFFGILRGSRYPIYQTYRHATAHSVDVPGPRATGVSLSARHIRLTPWGPKPDFNQASSEVPVASMELEIKEARSQAKKVQLGRVPSDSFLRVIAALEKYGMTPKEIQHNPGLFAMDPLEVEDRLETFKECGWETFSADMIVFDSVILMRRTAKNVIGSDSDSVTRSVVRALLNSLEVPDESQQSLLATIGNSATGTLTLHECRILALRHYLRGIYNDDHVQIILDTTMKPVNCSRPVKDVKIIMQMLEKDFKMPKERILKNLALLSRRRHHYRAILANPYYAGIDVRLCALGFPKLIYQTRETLTQLEEIFNKYDVSAFQIMRKLMASALNPKTVEERLAALQQEPDVWRFHKEPDFLALVIQYSEVGRRLDYLRGAGTDFGLSLLACTRAQFHMAVSKGKFSGPDSSVRPQHLLPVAEFLDEPITVVRKMLKMQIRNVPYFTNDTMEMKLVLEVLKKYKITKAQVQNCLSICLYPGEIVQKFADELFADPHVQARRTQENLLHYLLYRIEKESNFAGPAAWAPKTDNLDELDDEDPASIRSVGDRLKQNIVEHYHGVADPSVEPHDLGVSEDAKNADWFEDRQTV